MTTVNSSSESNIILYMNKSFYSRNPELHRKCPVKGCKGWYTTTPNANLMNHIRNTAKSELFDKELFDLNITPHFDYLKRNFVVIKNDKKYLMKK